MMYLGVVPICGSGTILISTEQLIHNVAEWLREDIKQIKLVPWPPRVEDLEEEEKLSPLVLRLLSALRGKKGVDLSPCTLTLTSLLMQYVMKQPTTTSINASITLHGMTRSKELLDSFHKLGMGISYSNILILRDAWTLHDLDRCSVCPDAIAEGQPSISIIDNDNFLSDTLYRRGHFTSLQLDVSTAPRTSSARVRGNCSEAALSHQRREDDVSSIE